MTKNEIIKMAHEAGIDAESDTLTCYRGFVKPLTRFATLVVANLDPKSFMSWQEGYEGGVVAEREACAKVCESLPVQQDRDVRDECAAAIRVRGNT